MKTCQLCGATYPDHVEFCPKDGLSLLGEGESDPWLGQRLRDTYELEQLIGAGGMGRVYRATQHPLDRPVAVKLVEGGAGRDRSGTALLKRFYREARLLARIHHSNVVTIFDFGNTGDGTFYLVMEYLEGRTLTDMVPAGEGLRLKGAIDLFDQICAGVGAAHSIGMVHRDLKPANIFSARQTGGGRVVKVMDFGLARNVGESKTLLTQTGMILGTPGYIAPELIGESASDATVRSDVYAMGAILYFLLTGQEVQSGGSAQEILARQLMEKLELGALRDRDDLDPKLLQILILKAMALDPAARHASCEELATAFRFATARE